MSAATVPQITFDRPELNRILALYGRMVAAGEWRDYALDFRAETAVFSIFRRASEMPLFRIEKRPELRSKQGQYSVIAAWPLLRMIRSRSGSRGRAGSSRSTPLK